jgi:hypothetical protein
MKAPAILSSFPSSSWHWIGGGVGTFGKHTAYSISGTAWYSGGEEAKAPPHGTLLPTESAGSLRVIGGQARVRHGRTQLATVALPLCGPDGARPGCANAGRHRRRRFRVVLAPAHPGKASREPKSGGRVVGVRMG